MMEEGRFGRAIVILGGVIITTLAVLALIASCGGRDEDGPALMPNLSHGEMLPVMLPVGTVVVHKQGGNRSFVAGFHRVVDIDLNEQRLLYVLCDEWDLAYDFCDEFESDALYRQYYVGIEYEGDDEFIDGIERLPVVPLWMKGESDDGDL